jgi:hypothetical protein
MGWQQMTAPNSSEKAFVVEFTDREMRLISGSLPAAVDRRRLDLLPQVLREWGREDLPMHLQHKPESVKRRRDRFWRLALVEKRAKELNEALAALDESDHRATAHAALRARAAAPGRHLRPGDGGAHRQH